MKKICVVCKTEFEGRGTLQVCSELCDRVRNRIRRERALLLEEKKRVACEHCKLEYEYMGKPRRYCRPECAKQAYVLDQNVRWCARKKRKYKKGHKWGDFTF